jgi:integrase
LRDKNSQTTTLILARLYYQGKEFVYTTGESIEPQHWNQEKQKVKEVWKAVDYQWTNKRLEEVRSAILQAHRNLTEEKREITNELLKFTTSVLLNRIQKIEAGKSSLYVHIEQVIKNRLLQTDNPKDDTVRKYRNTYERIKQFADKELHRPLEFADIDINFYNRFVKYLTEYPLATNTVGKEIRTLKRFMNLATLGGENTNLLFKSTEFKAPKKKIKHVYLTEQEVNALYEMELGTDLKREIRDLFIIGCRTSLRVSDYAKVINDNIESTGLICIPETQKTSEPAYIPVHWQVSEILKKYKGLPVIHADQTINRIIKQVCRQAGIKNKVPDTRQGRNKISEDLLVPKYELIGTHTGRRTCITNMYLEGFDLYYLMSLTGHRSIETLIGYIGVDNKLNAIRIKDSDYFKKASPTTSPSATD